MAKLNGYQVDILNTISGCGEWEGEKLGWMAMHVPPGWGPNIRALQKRGLIEERRTNLFYLTDQGQEALTSISTPDALRGGAK